MVFLRVLVDSFVLLKKCPRLFIPKILIAFFFFPLFILLPHYLLQVNIFSIADAAKLEGLQLLNILLQLMFILIYTIAIYVIDVFLVNPTYPVLVQQFYNKREINFGKALLDVLNRFGTIFPALLAVSILVFAAMLPFMFMLATALFLQNTFLLYLAILTAFISIFVIFILFYLIYPVSSLEKIDFGHTVKQTIKSSLKHKGDIGKAFLISLFISGVSYLLGFMIAGMSAPEYLVAKLGLFLVFVAIRLLVALFSTYQYVLNAVFYLGLEKGQFFRG